MGVGVLFNVIANISLYSLVKHQGIMCHYAGGWILSLSLQ